MRRPNLRTTFLLPVTLALALVAAGCGSDDESATTPTTPTPATVTETFQGAIAQGQTGSHAFVVSTTGAVTMGLTSVGPLSTMSLGVAIARWDGTACGAAITKNDNARAAATALTGTATAGNYCVQVYDSGNVPEGWTVTYTVEVKHP